MSTRKSKPHTWGTIFGRYADLKGQHTRQLIADYIRVRQVFKQSVYSTPQGPAACLGILYDEVDVPQWYRPVIERSILPALASEDVFNFPDVDPSKATIDQAFALRELIRDKERFFANKDAILNVLMAAYRRIFQSVVRRLPAAPAGKSSMSVPLHAMISDLPGLLDDIVRVLLDKDVIQNDILRQSHEVVWQNLCDANGHDRTKPVTKRFTLPADEKSPQPSTYLGGTPLLSLFDVQMPFAIPLEIQFAHTWVVSGSGHGKTTLATSMIYDHLPDVLKGNKSVVVIDSQNVLIPQLERLKIWERSNRLIVIDPTEPIACSLFDVPLSELNNALEMISFVFAKLSDNELTYRQANLFDYVSEFLITAVPNATLNDFRNMLDVRRASDYAAYIPNAREEVQDYLRTDFVKEKFTLDARSQVVTKLRAMFREPAFARMFAAPKTKLNLFNELERGVFCLIKPTKAALGEDGTKLFGRFWIAQMKLVAQKRQFTNKKTPTFFYIDEAQDYLRGGDPKFESILEQARKEKIGVTLLHHYADQLKSTELVQLLGANTATKICGSLASSDLTRFASYLQCDPSFILSQTPRKTFACRVNGLTPSAVSLEFPFIDLKKQPLMSEAAHRAMRAENMRKYGADLQTPPRPPIAVPTPAAPTPPQTEVPATPAPPATTTRQTPRRERPPSDDERHTRPTEE